MATIIGALPSILTNGTTADATQVMADFNFIVSQVNANAAGIGANSDITALTGLTTPLSSALGGTGVSIAPGNRVFAGPVGATSVPTFRSLVAGDFSTASANQALLGPATGSTATPTFRNLVGADGAYAVLLGSQNAAGSTSVQFTGIAVSSFQKLLLEVSGMVAASSNDNLCLQVGVGGGPTWNAGASYAEGNFFASGNAMSVSNSGAQNGTIISVGNATAPLAATIKIDSPSSTTITKRIAADYAGNNAVNVGRSVGIWTGDNSALSAIMIYFSNAASRSSAAAGRLIAAGSVQLWGIIPA